MSFDPNVIAALAELRHAAAHISRPLARAFQTLDDAGVFAALDEQTDYASATEILAESAADSLRKARQRLISDAMDRDEAEQSVPDPAEWGDTTSADMARHQGYVAASRLGKPERIPDALRPAHEHVFASPHSDEVCYGAEWCTLTYGEHRERARWEAAARHGVDASEVNWDATQH